MGQSLDEGRQLVRWQRSIDIAVMFRQFGGEIIATQEHLQGASPPDEPWQSLRARQQNLWVVSGSGNLPRA